MMRLLVLITFLLGFNHSALGQDPNWASYITLEKSQTIVIAKMHIENLEEGLGTLKVFKVLKGHSDLKDLKVQFSGRQQVRKNTKQAEPPKYWYSDGQEGIWLISKQNQAQRYDLRSNNLFYAKKWTPWIGEKLKMLQNRTWTLSQNGLSGSVIIDDAGANANYRFFYLCLRNESENPIYFNSHYRIKEAAQRRFDACITTPKGVCIQMVNGNHLDCRMSGEPGWALPVAQDFIKILPGRTIYLLTSGTLRSFFRNPEPGLYTFKASYHNNFESKDVKGKIWQGKIEFPSVQFSY